MTDSTNATPVFAVRGVSECFIHCTWPVLNGMLSHYRLLMQVMGKVYSVSQPTTSLTGMNCGCSNAVHGVATPSHVTVQGVATPNHVTVQGVAMLSHVTVQGVPTPSHLTVQGVAPGRLWAVPGNGGFSSLV